jgi:hypothetical protein
MAFCLPHLVDELDLPVGHCLYVVEKVPGELHTSTYLNTRPPLITRICVEAREVAFEEVQREVSYDGPEMSDASAWEFGNCVCFETWEDERRIYARHINWDEFYAADYFGDDNRYDSLYDMWTISLLSSNAAPH